MEIKDWINSIFDRCEILFNGEVIGREYLISAYRSFLSNTFSEEKHNVSFVLHTGSICFDIVAVLFAAISVLAMDEGDVESIMDSLEKGDIVVYDGGKYLYDGIVQKQFGKRPLSDHAVLIRDKDKSSAYVPENLWYKIKPYKGKSKTLDGRGLRRKVNKRNQFIASMFGISKEEIPSLISGSAVIVLPNRARADEIINNTSIFDLMDGRSYSLLELVTASYYTEGEEYRYSGNPENTDPNIKVTSKLSVARDLIYNPTNNKVLGLFVLENEGANQSVTELDELINRRSLRYVYVSYNVDSQKGSELLPVYEDANLFACTKEYLLRNSLPIDTLNVYTAALDREIDIIIDKEIQTTVIPTEYTIEPKLTSEYIQASSRVGRTFPGVVFTMYDGSKSRDRSHYEQFKSYHDSFYKYVEPTGATPFSGPARDRALHAVAITLMRYIVPELNEELAAIKFKREKYAKEIEYITSVITKRSKDISKRLDNGMIDDGDAICKEIMDIFEKWEARAEEYEDKIFAYGNKYMINSPGEDEGRLMKVFNTSPKDNKPFDTMTSMRNVDSQVAANIIVWE